MKEIFLSVGSNYGDRRKNVEDALQWLSRLLRDFRDSSIYETRAVQGYGPSYFNAVVSGYTDIDYESLNRDLKSYETICGRTSEARMRNEVIIDIDIVIVDNEIIRPVDFSREFFQIGYKEIRE